MLYSYCLINFRVSDSQSILISSSRSKNQALDPSSGDVKKNRTICDSINLVAAIKVAYCLKCTLGSLIPSNLAKFGNLKSSRSGISLKSAKSVKLLESRDPLSLKVNSS